MQRFINNPDEVVEDTVKGFVKAHRNLVRLAENPRVIAALNAPVEGKVGIITGGGSGHEPAFIGYTGKNMLDAVAVGELFSSPTAKSFYDAAHEANGGKGVLCLYGNYAGDNMNFDMASEILVEDEGIDVRTVRITDDVAAAPPDRVHDRRGIAGDVYAIKVTGGAATELDSLDEVERVARKTAANLRSMAVAVAAGSIPETGKLTFELADDEIEIGMGAHGEAGVYRQKLASADSVADQMMEKILADLPFSRGDEVALMINNLGATTMMEMLIVNRRIRQICEREGITVHRTDVGTWVTTQEMAGLSITLLKLDDELKHYLDLPAESLGYSRM